MAEPITFLACLVCGTTSSATLATVCLRCEKRRIDALVAERCAPLVEAAVGVLMAWDTWVFEAEWEAARDRLRAALADYHAAQGAGRGTLPTVNEFVGADPNFTGDMTTEDYVASQRDAEDDAWERRSKEQT